MLDINIIIKLEIPSIHDEWQHNSDYLKIIVGSKSVMERILLLLIITTNYY